MDLSVFQNALKQDLPLDVSNYLCWVLFNDTTGATVLSFGIFWDTSNGLWTTLEDSAVQFIYLPKHWKI